jgi:PAS domain S-box-containing protein
MSFLAAQSRPAGAARSAAYSVLTAVFVMSLFGAAAKKISTDQDLVFERALDNNSVAIAKNIESSTNAHFKSVNRMAARLSARKGAGMDIWGLDAANLIHDLPGIERLIVTDSSLKTLGVVNAPDYTEGHGDITGFLSPLIGKKELEVPGLLDIPAEGQESGPDALYHTPVWNDGKFSGVVIAEFDREHLLQEGTPAGVNQHSKVSFTPVSPRPISATKDYLRKKQIHLANQEVPIYVWPTSSFLEFHDSRLPLFVVVIGAIFSLLTGFLVRAAMQLFFKAEQLEASELMTRKIFKNAAIGKAIVSPLGRWVGVNPALCKLLGYSEEELLATDFQTLTHPEDLGKDLQLLEKLLLREIDSYQIEKRYRSKSSGYVWVLLSVSPVWKKDGDIDYFISQVQDLTELKKSEQKFYTLFQRSSHPHLIFNEKNGIIDCNQAALDILGYADKKELLRQHPAAFSPEFQPDGRASVEKSFEMDALARKAGYHRFEWVHRKSTGELFPVEVTLTIVEFGGALEILVVWYDLSERKRAEETRTQLIERLERTNTELERFAYVASHDLKEPLRMVCSFTELLMHEYGDRLDDTANKYISIAATSAKRMVALIDDLLDYARVGHEGVDDEEFSTRDCVEYALKNLEDQIFSKGATVRIGAMPNITSSKIRFMTVMQNLMGNALKYGRTDGTAEVLVSSEEKNGEYIFCVADNGIGIRSDYWKQIFEPFKRLHTGQEYPGTGMGLAICRKIVESAGGEIWVKSDEGKGAAFCFSLPKQRS